MLGLAAARDTQLWRFGIGDAEFERTRCRVLQMVASLRFGAFYLEDEPCVDAGVQVTELKALDIPAARILPRFTALLALQIENGIAARESWCDVQGREQCNRLVDPS